MECRGKCGACCIVPSISSYMPGMPNGKPAGQRCVHLMDDYSCAIFNHPGRPGVCGGFKPEHIVCGNNRSEAIKTLADLEGLSKYSHF